MDTVNDPLQWFWTILGVWNVCQDNESCVVIPVIAVCVIAILASCTLCLAYHRLPIETVLKLWGVKVSARKVGGAVRGKYHYVSLEWEYDDQYAAEFIVGEHTYRKHRGPWEVWLLPAMPLHCRAPHQRISGPAMVATRALCWFGFFFGGLFFGLAGIGNNVPDLGIIGFVLMLIPVICGIPCWLCCRCPIGGTVARTDDFSGCLCCPSMRGHIQPEAVTPVGARTAPGANVVTSADVVVGDPSFSAVVVKAGAGMKSIATEMHPPSFSAAAAEARTLGTLEPTDAAGVGSGDPELPRYEDVV